MKKSTILNLTFQVIMFFSFIFFLITIHPESLDKNSFFFPIMFLGFISVTFSEISNHFTNLRDDEDPVKIYSPAVIVKWSWANTIVHSIILLLLTTYLVAVVIPKYSTSYFWLILNILWLVLCITAIYKEYQLRKKIAMQKTVR